MRPVLGTLAIVVLYAAVMVSTNTRFTILDDESSIIAISGHPIIPALQLFLTGAGTHEMPGAPGLDSEARNHFTFRNRIRQVDRRPHLHPSVTL
ncbi:MAG: hypothetical protein WAM85_20325 [Terracidiphilus sp.]